jgi:hypothetical protein
MQIKLLIFLILLASLTFGQTLNVDNVYNFAPHKLTKAEQEKKIPTLDVLWNKVKSDTSKNLPLLRNELNKPNHNPYFYYDGAVLLYSLSDTKNDKTMAANAIANCDLSDIPPEAYVGILNEFSKDGIDVTKAAIKILNDTAFTFFLPQHAMYFNQGECLAYMLLPEKKEFYVDTLIFLFKSVNSNSQKSILYTLWFTYSCKGDSLIKASVNDKTISKDVSNYAKDMMKSPELPNEIKEQIKSLDKSKIDELRKKSLTRFSDEALDELMLSTLALRKNENCR